MMTGRQDKDHEGFSEMIAMVIADRGVVTKFLTKATHVWKSFCPSEGVIYHSSEPQQQDCEAAHHIASTIGKQRLTNATVPLTAKYTHVKSFGCSFSTQSGTPCHKPRLLTFLVGLPTSAEARWKHP